MNLSMKSQNNENIDLDIQDKFFLIFFCLLMIFMMLLMAKSLLGGIQ